MVLGYEWKFNPLQVDRWRRCVRGFVGKYGWLPLALRERKREGYVKVKVRVPRVFDEAITAAAAALTSANLSLGAEGYLVTVSSLCRRYLATRFAIYRYPDEFCFDGIESVAEFRKAIRRALVECVGWVDNRRKREPNGDSSEDCELVDVFFYTVEPFRKRFRKIAKALGVSLGELLVFCAHFSVTLTDIENKLVELKVSGVKARPHIKPYLYPPVAKDFLAVVPHLRPESIETGKIYKENFVRKQSEEERRLQEEMRKIFEESINKRQSSKESFGGAPEPKTPSLFSFNTTFDIENYDVDVDARIKEFLLNKQRAEGDDEECDYEFVFVHITEDGTVSSMSLDEAKEFIAKRNSAPNFNLTEAYVTVCKYIWWNFWKFDYIPDKVLTHCPICGDPLPNIRMPVNIFFCPKCVAPFACKKVKGKVKRNIEEVAKVCSGRLDEGEEDVAFMELVDRVTAPKKEPIKELEEFKRAARLFKHSVISAIKRTGGGNKEVLCLLIDMIMDYLREKQVKEEDYEYHPYFGSKRQPQHSPEFYNELIPILLGETLLGDPEGEERLKPNGVLLTLNGPLLAAMLNLPYEEHYPRTQQTIDALTNCLDKLPFEGNKTTYVPQFEQVGKKLYLIALMKIDNGALKPIGIIGRVYPPIFVEIDGVLYVLKDVHDCTNEPYLPGWVKPVNSGELADVFLRRIHKILSESKG